MDGFATIRGFNQPYLRSLSTAQCPGTFRVDGGTQALNDASNNKGYLAFTIDKRSRLAGIDLMFDVLPTAGANAKARIRVGIMNVKASDNKVGSYLPGSGSTFCIVRNGSASLGTDSAGNAEIDAIAANDDSVDGLNAGVSKIRFPTPIDLLPGSYYLGLIWENPIFTGGTIRKGNLASYGGDIVDWYEGTVVTFASADFADNPTLSNATASGWFAIMGVLKFAPV